ncbi:MAG: hypothetical protein PSX36_03110 [bacterium]|nr:hypothetical protein [bacterium]
MKKKIMITAALLAVMLASAQDSLRDLYPKNKKGNEILPRKGDIGLGFNCLPIIDVLFGTINFATPYPGSSNMVQYTANSNNQIVGKYYLKDKAAIRVRFGINTLSGSMTNQVQDAKAMYTASFGTQDDRNAASLLRVDDIATFAKNNWLLSVGYEKRRGYRRLQGYYGAEFGIGRTGSVQSFKYGNAFSDLYPVQYTDNFNALTVAVQTPTSAGRVTRELEAKNGGGMRYGIRGFIGIEYFIFAKISIAAEYGWGYAITRSRAATSTREVYNNGQNGPAVFKEEVDIDAREGQRGFSVDNNNGTVFSMNNTLGGNTSLSGGAGALTILFHF